MENYFDVRGLEILTKLLPNCLIEKNGNRLTVEQKGKIVKLEADFNKLFELIDNDRLYRQIDSMEWHWSQLANLIELELK